MGGGWLIPLLNLLAMGGGPVAAESAIPGGTFRRSAAEWGRTFDRADGIDRTFARDDAGRIWEVNGN